MSTIMESLTNIAAEAAGLAIYDHMGSGQDAYLATKTDAKALIPRHLIEIMHRKLPANVQAHLFGHGVGLTQDPDTFMVAIAPITSNDQAVPELIMTTMSHRLFERTRIEKKRRTTSENHDRIVIHTYDTDDEDRVMRCDILQTMSSIWIRGQLHKFIIWSQSRDEYHYNCYLDGEKHGRQERILCGNHETTEWRHGQKHGTYTHRISGTLIKLHKFVRDRLHGRVREWNMHGRLILDVEYRNGHPHGFRVLFMDGDPVCFMYVHGARQNLIMMAGHDITDWGRKWLTPAQLDRIPREYWPALGRKN